MTVLRRSTVFLGVLVVLSCMGRSPDHAMAQQAPKTGQAKKEVVDPEGPRILITYDEAIALFKGKPAKMTISRAKTWAGIYLVDFSKNPLKAVPACDCKTSGDDFIHPDGMRFIHMGGIAGDVGPIMIHQWDKDGRVIATNEVGKGAKCRWWTHPKTGEEYVMFGDHRSCQGDVPEGRTLIRQIKKGTAEPV